MVRGGEDSSKRKLKRGVRLKGNDSDDSDEDYILSDEGNEVSACSDEDYGSSVDGDASEASFDSCAEEEAEEEERKVRRKAKKVGKLKRRKSVESFKGVEDYEFDMEEEEEDEDEDEDEDEEWNEVKTTGRSKVQLQGGFSRLRRNRVVRSKIKEEDEEDKEEEMDEVKTTGKSEMQGGFSGPRKNGALHCIKKNEDEEEEEEEEGDQENNEVRATSRSKVQGGSSCMRKNGVIHSKRKRRLVYNEDDENDDDDEEFAPSNDEEEEDDDDDDGDDEDFTADEDFLDEEESSVKRKKNKKKAGKQVLRKKDSGSRRNRRSNYMASKKPRRSKYMASKKPMRKKARKACGFRRKVQSDNDGDFIDNGLVSRDKGEMKTGSKRRRFFVDSDSDFAPSPSIEYEYTISEEEREQVREAKEFCQVKPDLKGSLTSDKIQEVMILPPERKPKVRKGKEKIEEEVRTEVAKKVCGICLSEEDKRRVRGRLNCCKHYFCFTCIREWAKVESRCPLCKQRFNTITKPARSKAVVDVKEVIIPIPERDQVYQPTEEELRSYLYPYEDVICSECHQGGHDDLMLLCDECDSSAHTFCIGLGYEVPEGSWFCRDCKPLAPESPCSIARTGLSDQRTASNASTPRISTGINNAGEGFDLNSVSQGLDALPSPRQYIGGFPATLPFSGAGASTVSSRMRLQHHVQQRLSERHDRPDGIFPNSQSDQVRDAMIPRESTLLSEERFSENPSPMMQVTDLFPPSFSQSRRQMGQDPITVFSGIANGALWPGLAERNTLPSYQQQIRQCSSRSNNFCDREGSGFQTAKDQLQLMVKSHLKILSRTIEIAQCKLDEIAKGSTRTILAACELEQRSNEVAPLPVAPPPNCDHIESITGSKVSFWEGCCSSCFDSFVGDVVKKILDAKLSEQRQWLNLNLAL